jgi:peptidoglycan/xylan/chitin deacetylase (PgdA/CDA1 family)
VHSLPRRALVVTLDDGAAGNFQLLRVFRQHSVVPTIFLTTGIVGTDRAFWWTLLPGGGVEADSLKAVPDADRLATLAAHGHSEFDAAPTRSALSSAEIQKMRASVDFQSHTALHPVLSRCADERAWAEIAGSKADLEGRYGLDIYALAYPNGTPADFGPREAAMTARAGYECAVTMVPGTNGPRTDLFALRRIPIPDDASCDEALVRASLLHSRLSWFRRRPGSV